MKSGKDLYEFPAYRKYIASPGDSFRCRHPMYMMNIVSRDDRAASAVSRASASACEDRPAR
jgi:hypothetical protein